jgi:hypothetical protein
MTDQPDYTAMSGAEFKSAVGVDPEKWAAAFEQCMGKAVVVSGFSLSSSREGRVAYMVGWFRDAMDAARHDARTSSGAWRYDD